MRFYNLSRLPNIHNALLGLSCYVLLCQPANAQEQTPAKLHISTAFLTEALVNTGGAADIIPPGYQIPDYIRLGFDTISGISGQSGSSETFRALETKLSETFGAPIHCNPSECQWGPKRHKIGDDRLLSLQLGHGEILLSLRKPQERLTHPQALLSSYRVTATVNGQAVRVKRYYQP